MFSRRAAPPSWLGSLWNRLAVSAVLMLFLLLLWARLGGFYRGYLLGQERALAGKEADRLSAVLSSAVSLRVARLPGLAANARTHPVEEFRGRHFSDFAAALQGGDPAIRAVAFFPAEGQALVYPPAAENDLPASSLAGLASSADERLSAAAQRTMKIHRVALSSPGEISPGVNGLYACQAVYNGGAFLGLALIALDLDPLLDVPDLPLSSSGLRYALRDPAGQVFYGDPAVFEREPVLAAVMLPEGNWTLGAAPAAGWLAGARAEMAAFWSVGFLLALMAAAISYQVFNSQADLRRMVLERSAALAQSEARYAAIVDVVNEGIWDWDLRTGEVFASDFCYRLGGWQRDDFAPQDWLSYIHPEDVPKANEAIQKGTASGQGFDVALRARRKDGGWFHALVRGRALEWDAAGAPLRMSGALTDISAQVEAEEQLRQSEAKFRALFNNNHAAMLLVHPESGAILEANPAACAFYGWPLGTLTAMKISDINTLSEAEVKAEMQSALAERRNHFLFRHRLASGEVRDVEVFSGPIEFGGRTLLYSIVHDVTARRQAERALEESEARYRGLLEMAPVGIGVYSEGRIRYINPAGARLLGFADPEQAVGRQISDFLDPRAQADLPQIHARLLAGEPGVYPVVAAFHPHNGGEILVEVTENLIAYQGAPAFQVIFADVTERRKAQQEILAAQAELERLLAEADISRLALLSVVEDQRLAEEKLNQLNAELELRVRQRTAQLEAANRELESFSYSVSHDLRAPLRGVDGWSLALLEDYGAALDERGRQYLERVRAETRHMSQLIEDLLRLSRLARLEMNLAPVDLSALAESIAARLQEEEPQRQVEFTAQPGVVVQGDPNLLEIALTNLLSNAYKFTALQPQPRVEFGRLNWDGKPAYYVRDNGVGFDMANARRLFGAFQRLHKQAEFPGVGVGLAIVQRVIHRHGGEVWAEAVPGQGATFFFTIPPAV